MIKTRNGQRIDLSSLHVAEIKNVVQSVLKSCEHGARPLLLFTDTLQNPSILYFVMAHDNESTLAVYAADCKGLTHYPSLTQHHPSFHFLERQLWEDTGIEPKGHPWLKPIRFSSDRHNPDMDVVDYPFYRVEGEEIHEVGVGPIHAGVIEPGHFRFQCKGEDVLHLEIQLGYQHRGIERFFEHSKIPNSIHIAESIAGDSVMAHTWAHAQCIESLMGLSIPKRAEYIRGIALELERTAIHIGDLSALCNDIAYHMGTNVFATNRTSLINSSLYLCGSRFSRGLMTLGGVHFDYTEEKIQTLINVISEVEYNCTLMAETMFNAPSVLSRLEKTGVVTKKTAQEIGMVGPAGRASGLIGDIRTDHSYGPYKTTPLHALHLDGGDVYARAYIRYLEIKESFRWLRKVLPTLPSGTITAPIIPIASNALAIGITEGWRGETVHAAITDVHGTISRYVIKDPSCNNWFALALAVRNNGISDFPLCNKSFNLSYCGHDL